MLRLRSEKSRRAGEIFPAAISGRTHAVRIQIEPTEILAKLDGVECRVWNGITEDDKQVIVFVHRIASKDDLSGELIPRIVLKTEMEEIHEA
jgi:hypothetical protein